MIGLPESGQDHRADAPTERRILEVAFFELPAE
jgi:hypothetical protein